MGVTIGALLVAILGQATAMAGSGQAAAELADLEHVWNRAHVQGDVEALDRLMADDIVIIVPRMPAFTKAEALSVFRGGRMKFTQYETSGLTVREYGTSAVVTGSLKRTRSMGERTIHDDWRFTKTYVRTPKGWRVVSFHASEAGS